MSSIDTKSSDVLIEAEEDIMGLVNAQNKKRSNFVVLAALGVVAVIVIIVIAATAGGGSSSEEIAATEAAKTGEVVSTAVFKAAYEDIGVSVEDFAACVSSGDCEIVGANDECDEVDTTGDCDEVLEVHVDEQAEIVMAELSGSDVSEVSCQDGLCTGVSTTDLCDSIDEVDCKEGDEDWDCNELLSTGDCQEGLLSYNNECDGIGCNAYGYSECAFCYYGARRSLSSEVNSQSTDLAGTDDSFDLFEDEYPVCSEDVIATHREYAQTNTHACFTSSSTSTSTSSTTSTTSEVIVPVEPATEPEPEPETTEPETETETHMPPPPPETDTVTETITETITETHMPPPPETDTVTETITETITETHMPPPPVTVTETITETITETHMPPPPVTVTETVTETEGSCEQLYEQCLGHIYSLYSVQGIEIEWETNCDEWNEALNCIVETIEVCGWDDDDMVHSFCTLSGDDDVIIHLSDHCGSHMFDQCDGFEPRSDDDDDSAEESESEEDSESY